MVRKALDLSCLIFLLCGLRLTASAAEDPTAPLNWTKPKIHNQAKVKNNYPLPSLQSIVCEERKSNCYAIVNNKVVNRGEVISGYRIKNITSEKVDVTRSGKQWELNMFPLDIKQ
ncbi:MSHA biogenesis protein MshK [Vibrio hannami]|uniref:MSHA biogenesis protein MshK n=1 Tax=Vibrio hannami TaxID=2717094 RepID=UPI00240FE141|nr:MSHA biogenesis protein MshK [Vibrio hannami]MDG3084800.1 MSHA biogenesis protein MshK [Vibrio hannami]